MAATEAFINGLLNSAFNGTTYTGGTIQMALFKTGLPSTTGVEISGGGYSRQTLTFSSASAKKISTSATATFSNMPTSQTVKAYGIYDDGILIDEKLLTTPLTPSVTTNQLEVSYSFELGV